MMDMNKEIKKYPIYYPKKGKLVRCFFVENIHCYNHLTLQLHHFVPFTDWKKNTKDVRNLTDEKLILMPIQMHQHLENPVYKLPVDEFEEIYGIHPNKLLFDINSKNPDMQIPWHLEEDISENDLDCFEEIA